MYVLIVILVASCNGIVNESTDTIYNDKNNSNFETTLNVQNTLHAESKSKDSTNTTTSGDGCVSCIDPCLVDPITLECTDGPLNPGSDPLPPSFSTSLNSTQYPGHSSWFEVEASTSSNAVFEWMQIDLTVDRYGNNLVDESVYKINTKSIEIDEYVFIGTLSPAQYNLKSVHTGEYDVSDSREVTNLKNVIY